MTQLGSKKSRKGCNICKRRRVKCDEQAPCSNCMRRNEECSLLEDTPSAGSDATTEPGVPNSNEEWIQDLTSTACGRFHFREGTVSIAWRDYVPQQALKHTFLMHGILAFAALHLAHEQPEDQMRYLRLCDKHQNIALRTFRELLTSSNVSPELADALFAQSSLISLSSMARSCIANESKAVSVDAIAELFILTKGVREIIFVHHDHIHNGPMKEMFDNHEYAPGTVVLLPPEMSNLFEALRQMIESYGLNSDALNHCQAALSQLEEIYRNVIYFGTRDNLETGQIFRFHVMVSMEYIRLLQARSQPALVLLAYYAAMITGIPTTWYNQNFAEYTLRGISLELDENMQYWIRWPQRQVEERLASLGVISHERES